MKWFPMPELQDLVDALKKTEKYKTQLAHVKSDRILYTNFTKKQSKVKGKIGQIPPRFAVSVEDKYDYFLEVNQENWIAATEGERLYIILHELMHIPVEGFDKESKSYKKVIKHDLEDFTFLVEEYGTNLEKAEELVDLIK